MSEKTTEQVRKVPNPTGKGGFGDHPELINAGGRPKNQESFTYWMNQFKNMEKDEFLSWEKKNPTHSMAASLAYARVFRSRNELREFQEVANRTEGLPKQPMELSGPGGGPIETLEIDTINRIYGGDRTTSDNSEKDGGSSRPVD